MSVSPMTGPSRDLANNVCKLHKHVQLSVGVALLYECGSGGIPGALSLRETCQAILHEVIQMQDGQSGAGCVAGVVQLQLFKLLREESNQKRWWTHPTLSNRLTRGTFHVMLVTIGGIRKCFPVCRDVR